MRLDQAVGERENISRNKAAELIKNGLVLINGKAATKPAQTVNETDEITLTTADRYVSRAAFKLLGFLDKTGLDVTGLNCLDVGSSTGGFTQVLFERGAARVSAVDVGQNQLHDRLRGHPALSLFEGVDIREFKAEKPFDLVVCDASFISLLHLIDAIDRLAADKIVLLFKPQFEVGKTAKRDRNGVVTDEAAIKLALARFEEACAKLGWELTATMPSPLPGKEGNIEYLYGYRKIQR